MNPRTLTILIVDNEPEMTHSVKELLEKSGGHTVHTSHNGEDALLKITLLHPDVVILDIGLSDIDGFEVARRIKQENIAPPFLIALSGYGQQENKDRAKEVGFNEYVVKPASIRVIQEVIQRA